jgi:hypothetical protein
VNSHFKAAIPIVLLASALMANAQTLRVQVLNGKTGKPVTNEHVNLFRTGDFGDLTGYRNMRGFTTDSNGFITASDFAPDTDSFYVAVDWHRQCTKKSQVNQVAFSLQEISTRGIVSENTCKPKLERSATPGTLILFVRDETFFEKMAH